MLRRSFIGSCLLSLCTLGYVRADSVCIREHCTNLEWLENFVKYLKHAHCGKIVYTTSDGKNVEGPAIKCREIRHTDVCIITCEKRYDADYNFDIMLLLDRHGNVIYKEDVRGMRVKGQSKAYRYIGDEQHVYSTQFSFPIPGIQTNNHDLGSPTPLSMLDEESKAWIKKHGDPVSPFRSA